MSARGLCAVVGVALMAAGCGGSQRPATPVAIHLDGKRAPGDYVSETAASGTRFLVPASLLDRQGNQVFDVSQPSGTTVGEPAGTVTSAPPPYRVAVVSATAVVPQSAHVELLASGESGRRFALSWEDTCGWTKQGHAAVGGTGGAGIEIMRSPAVALVKLPALNGGVPLCYLAATAGTRTLTRALRLSIIDY